MEHLINAYAYFVCAGILFAIYGFERWLTRNRW